MNCRQICQQLKMTAADSKKRLTDVADTEQFQRIIQTVSLPPLKRNNRRAFQKARRSLDVAAAVKNLARTGRVTIVFEKISAEETNTNAKLIVPDEPQQLTDPAAGILPGYGPFTVCRIPDPLWSLFFQPSKAVFFN